MRLRLDLRASLHVLQGGGGGGRFNQCSSNLLQPLKGYSLFWLTRHSLYSWLTRYSQVWRSEHSHDGRKWGAPLLEPLPYKNRSSERGAEWRDASPEGGEGRKKRKMGNEGGFPRGSVEGLIMPQLCLEQRNSSYPQLCQEETEWGADPQRNFERRGT